MRKNGIKTIAIITVMAATLTACGEKKKVDYVDNGKSDEIVVTDVENVDDSASLAGAENKTYDGIPETITYDIACDKVTVTVDAKVTVPDKYENCKVVELQRDIMTDEKLSGYVNDIFDEGSSFLYMPYNEQQASMLKDKLTNIANDTSDEQLKRVIEERYLGMLDESLEMYKDTNNEVSEEVKYHEIVKIDQYSQDEINCELCNVVGTIDGEYYIMEAYRDKFNQYIRLKMLKDDGISYSDVGAEYSTLIGAENKCSYNKEEAEQLAIDYVNKLGIENMTVVKTNEVTWNNYYDEVVVVMEAGGYDASSKLEGYFVYLGRAYDNYTTVYSTDEFMNFSGMYFEDDKINERIAIGGNEFIKVWVTDAGVREYEYCNQMKESKVISESTTLLDFNSVNDIAIEKMTDFANQNMMAFEINKVVLGYATVEQDGNSALVPAWYYFMDDGTGSESYVFEYPMVIINAIDGTLIQSTIDGIG